MVVVVTNIVYIIIMDLQYSPTSYAHLYYIYIIHRFSTKYLVKKKKKTHILVHTCTYSKLFKLYICFNNLIIESVHYVSLTLFTF